MSGDRYDVDSEVVLPAGMAIVVPPGAVRPTGASRADRGPDGRSASGAKRVIFPPFVHRGELRRAPAL